MRAAYSVPQFKVRLHWCRPINDNSDKYSAGLVGQTVWSLDSRAVVDTPGKPQTGYKPVAKEVRELRACSTLARCKLQVHR